MYDDVIFCGSNKILLISQYDEKIINKTAIQLLDVHTGKSSPNAPQFDFGKSEQFENKSQYFITGVAYDNLQKQTLIAYRELDDRSYERTYNIYIAVFIELGTIYY